MQLPARIGKYQIEEYLGGGMAEVYRAVDCLLHRTVAFKVLSPQGAADRSMRQRFLTEARLGSQVNHPNIVKTLDYSEEGEAPFLVLEFLRGHSLLKLIKDGGTGTMSNRVRIAVESARALEHVHSMGILHRDIKSDNIHVDEKGTARLIDFGIAKSADLNMTMPGMVVGTPYYMPPEQVRGEPASVRTDIYSFGLVMYELFSGVRARSGDTMARLMEEILTKTVSFEPLKQAQVPDELRTIVETCAAQDPVQRPDSFAIVIGWLESWLAAHPVTGTSNAQTGSTASVLAHKAGGRRNRMAWVYGAAALMLAAGAGWTGMSQFGGAPATGDVVRLPGGVWIDRMEVTNEQYRAFARRTSRQLPSGFESDSPGLPVVNVTAWDADAYCRWAGKRLPRESEWMQAAGGDKRRFPWGDKADTSLANVSDDAEMKKHLVSADAMRDGASPLGVLQLVGNAAEWVADRRPPTVFAVQGYAKLLQPAPTDAEEWRIIKGGSFQRPLAEGAIKEWFPAPSRYAAPDVGFRCALDK